MSRTPGNTPETPATRFLREHRVAFSSHPYAYEEHGGTKVSARELNVHEHSVVKTLIMEDEGRHPLVQGNRTDPTYPAAKHRSLS